MSIAVIILTYDEQLHIARAIESCFQFTDQILVVDSGSTDRTVEIAESLGALVKVNKFINQAQQFNWALKFCSLEASWIFRLDADEIVSDRLAKQLLAISANPNTFENGFTVNRYIAWMGSPIRWGGVFPLEVVRLFRNGYGKSEDRWMDEHILIKGEIGKLDGELIDDNLKPLSWWVVKHNNYASREVIEILKTESEPSKDNKSSSLTPHSKKKRAVRKMLYANLPLGLRPFVYFSYRYFVRLGFLEGFRGFSFHFLQCFWYRLLVDAKLLEVKNYARKKDVELDIAIKEILEIDPNSF